MMNILYLTPASQELIEAVAYYDEQVYGFGEQLLKAVQRIENLILDHPEMYHAIRYDIRRAPVPRFPYSLLYRVERDQVIILAIMHQRRKPDYWYDRL